MEDMRDVYDRTSSELARKLSETQLSDEQRALIRLGMEFAYSAAFSERTCDMHGSHSAAEKYQSGYKSMLQKVQ